MLSLIALLACTTIPTPVGPVVIDPGLGIGWSSSESLEKICGERCDVLERQKVGELELVVFAHGGADAELGIHVAGKWWAAAGDGFRPMRGRHSPGGREFDLSSARLDNGVLTLSTHAHGSSFGPGGGPSSSHRSSATRVCHLGDAVSCYDHQVFSENCNSAPGGDPVCSTVGADPRG